MSGYRSVISSIEGWQGKTDAEIVAEATAKTIPFADPEWWTVWGFALIIGAENVTPLLDRLKLTAFAWVGDAAKAVGCPFGEKAVNDQLLASGDPDLIKLAQATRYNMSLCQKFGVQEDPAAIAATAEIMRVEILRDAGKAASRARFSNNMNDWDNWPGPSTPPPQL